MKHLVATRIAGQTYRCWTGSQLNLGRYAAFVASIHLHQHRGTMIRRCRVKSVRMVSLLLMGWSAAGCADGTRLSTLESELALMRADIAVLRDSVHEVASDLAVHKVLESWGDFALLYPGDDGYSLLRTDL